MVQIRLENDGFAGVGEVIAGVTNDGVNIILLTLGEIGDPLTLYGNFWLYDLTGNYLYQTSLYEVEVGGIVYNGVYLIASIASQVKIFDHNGVVIIDDHPINDLPNQTYEALAYNGINYFFGSGSELYVIDSLLSGVTTSTTTLQDGDGLIYAVKGLTYDGKTLWIIYEKEEGGNTFLGYINMEDLFIMEVDDLGVINGNGITSLKRGDELTLTVDNDLYAIILAD